PAAAHRAVAVQPAGGLADPRLRRDARRAAARVHVVHAVAPAVQPMCSLRNAMSSLRPSSAVSQITGAPAACTTATSSCGSIWPVPKLAWRSRADPAASVEALQRTDSLRRGAAVMRATASLGAPPAAP